MIYESYCVTYTSHFFTDKFVAPVLNPPHDTFRTETLWNFTFECAVYNISSNLSDVFLDVVFGPIYHSNQTIIPRDNETDMIDAILVVGTENQVVLTFKKICINFFMTN